MLNKNDPLIGAVQEVMKRNQAERNAAKLVNEKFGVTDRKALPHEKQSAWDAEYKSVLNEGLHPNQQKLDVHEPEKDKLTAQDFKMLRAKKKPMEEATDGDTTSPSSMGIKKPDYASGTPDYANKGPQMVNRAAKTSLPSGTMKEEMTDAQMKKREKIVMSMKKKMAGFKDRYGERAKDVMYATATKQAMKEDNEGFNGRHGLSVTASAGKQAVADQLNERLVDTRQRTSRLAPMHTQGIKQTKARLAREPAEPAKTWSQRAAEIGRGVEASARGVAAGLTDVGQTSLGYKPLSDYALDAITPGRGQNLAREFPRATSIGQQSGQLASLASAGGIAKNVIKKGSKLLAPSLRGAATAADKSAGAVPAAAAKKADDVVSVTDKFRANAANRRYNPAGAEAKPPTAPPKQPTTQSGVPAMVGKSKVGPSKIERVGPFNPIGPRAPARPTTPNAAAGNAARVAARQRLAAASKDKVLKGAAATGLGAVGLKVAQNQYSATTPATAQNTTAGTPAASKPAASTAQAPVPKARPATAPAAPAASTAQAPKPAAVAQQKPVATTQQRPAAPAVAQPSAAERRENRRLLDRGQVVGQQAIAAQQRSGTGVTTGTTIQQKAAPQVKRPVGTGREK